MKIGSVTLPSPFVVSPMAGMTDTAFRRLVKRQGGCGLVVSEMVSSEGLVRGIDRTLEYAEYTEEERPVSIQIFGGDPERMAEAARVVEGMGADIVDVNMGCPVPKIAKHHAGCSLMRDPAHAASIVRAMTGAVGIPVTVKMRKGWDETDISAPDVARRVEDAGAAAITIHGRTARQSYCGPGRLGLRERGRPGRHHSRLRVGRLHRAGPGGRQARGRRQRRVRRTRGPPQPVDPRPGARPARRAPAACGDARTSAGSSSLTTSSCCSTIRPAKPKGFRHVAPGPGGGQRRPGAGPRSLGHQQGPSALLVVLEGARGRVAPADGRQQRGVDRAAARHRGVVLPRRSRARPWPVTASARRRLASASPSTWTARSPTCTSALRREAERLFGPAPPRPRP